MDFITNHEVQPLLGIFFLGEKTVTISCYSAGVAINFGAFCMVIPISKGSRGLEKIHSVRKIAKQKQVCLQGKVPAKIPLQTIVTGTDWFPAFR